MSWCPSFLSGGSLSVFNHVVSHRCQLQYSCLENLMDREVWQVHRVAKSQTQLEQLSLHALTGESVLPENLPNSCDVRVPCAHDAQTSLGNQFLCHSPLHLLPPMELLRPSHLLLFGWAPSLRKWRLAHGVLSQVPPLSTKVINKPHPTPTSCRPSLYLQNLMQEELVKYLIK